MKQIKNIILASSSPRRLELLNLIGIIPKRVLPPKIDESNKIPSIKKKVSEIALKKALYIKKKFNISNEFIISADTTVYRAGTIFNKPKNTFDVTSHLQCLSGKKHFVYGGICVVAPNGKISNRVIITEVYFKKISKCDYDNLFLINDGIGKAGGYSIQSSGALLVKKIKGSFSNVVGLSLYDVNNMLIGLGWKKSK